MKISYMNVEYCYHSGSDLEVVNAARVSFHKKSEWVHISASEGEILSHKDARLINYLAKHNHWTPFAHNSITLRIKAPIFVARQLGKHQVGLVWNEVSRRYVDEEPEFYFPKYWRKKADNVKQGSSDEVVDVSALHVEEAIDVQLLYQYKNLLAMEVCPEQARMVLPQNMMTEWIWTGSLAAFSRVAKLRLDPHTQQETQELVGALARVVEPLFPVSWKALMEN